MPRKEWKVRVVEALGPSGDKGDLEVEYTFGMSAPGLILSVKPNGTKHGQRSWRIRPMINKKRQTVTLGTFNSELDADYIGMDQARHKAIAERDKLRARAKSITAHLTYGDIARTWLERDVKVNNRTWRDTESLYVRVVEPTFASRPIDEIETAEIVELCDEISATSPATADKVLNLFSATYNFARTRGQAKHNPAQGVRRYTVGSRKRVPTPDELRALWRHVDDYDRPQTARLIRLTLLTGRRVNELAGLRRDEVKLGHPTHGSHFDVPAERSKAKVDQAVPITPEAGKIIATQLADEPDSDFVFPGRQAGKPTGGPMHRRTPLTVVWSVIEDQGLEPFHIHDLRRTVATTMAELNVDPLVIELCAGRATRRGVSTVYNKFDYLPQRRVALEAWEARLMQVVNAS